MCVGYVDPKVLRPTCFRKRCNGGVSMYRHAREIVSFLQRFHPEFNTFTINSVLLSDTLIPFYQPILEVDINCLLKLLCCSACNVDMVQRDGGMLLKRGGYVLPAVE